MKNRFFMFPVLALLSADAARSAVLLTEGFDDISVLPEAGWVFLNASEPEGILTWFQGVESVFAAQGGAATSYIGANFENTSGVGIISTWLMTPELDLGNPIVVRFWTRCPGSEYPDRLRVRLSTSGSSSQPSDFSTVPLTINSNLDPGGYPVIWTLYQVTLHGAGTGRIAFHYDVTESGPDGKKGDFIGIDTLSVTAIPETTGYLALGSLLAWGSMLRVRRGRGHGEV